VKKPIRVFIKYAREITEQIFDYNWWEKPDSCMYQVCEWNYRTDFLTTIDENNPIRVFINLTS